MNYTFSTSSYENITREITAGKSRSFVPMLDFRQHHLDSPQSLSKRLKAKPVAQ
jgi:hypothetical protein